MYAGIMHLRKDIRMNKPGSSRKDIIVSVRLPKTLVDELKDLQQINHFMDLSDEMRFIIRKYLKFLPSQPDKQQDILDPDVVLEQKKRDQDIEDLKKNFGKMLDSFKGKDVAQDKHAERNNEK